MCGRVGEEGKETGSRTEEAYESKMVGWSEIADCALPQTMTRSSKTPNSSQPRSLTFGTCSAVAAAVLFLFLYFQSGSPASDAPPPNPRGSWKQVHQALGISLDISPTALREQISINLSPEYKLPLHLIDQDRNPGFTKDKANSLQDFTAALRSISGKPRRQQ